MTPRSFDIFSQKLPLVKTAAGTCTSMLPGLPGLQTCKARKDPTMHVPGRLPYGSTMVHVPVEDGRMIKSNYHAVTVVEGRKNVVNMIPPKSTTA